MANNLLMLFKLDADTIAFLSLIVSIVGAVAAIFAAFYAKKAATKDELSRVEQNTQYAEHFSNKILSIDTPIHPQENQEDSQAQAEQKTPQVQPEPLQTQAERKTSQAQQEASPAHQESSQLQVQREGSPAHREPSQVEAQPISISVKGEAMGEVPLELFLTLQDASVRVSRVERLSEAGKSLGSSSCTATDNVQVFKSILAPEKVSRWWNAGESASEGEARSVLRVYLLDASGKEVYRDMPVSIVQGLRNVGIATLVVWTIKGSI